MKKNKKTTDEHNDSDFNNLIKPFMIRVVCKIWESTQTPYLEDNRRPRAIEKNHQGGYVNNNR